MSVFEFLILGLATWRLSSLLVNEEGPWSLLARSRHAFGVRYDDMSRPYGRNVLAKMLTCIWCTSIWVGIVVYGSFLMMPKGTLLIMTTLALSALVILIEEMICGKS